MGDFEKLKGRYLLISMNVKEGELIRAKYVSVL